MRAGDYKKEWRKRYFVLRAGGSIAYFREWTGVGCGGGAVEWNVRRARSPHGVDGAWMAHRKQLEQVHQLQRGSAASWKKGDGAAQGVRPLES